MSEISELILLLNKQHQEQMAVLCGEHQEQMTMLQEQLKILQSSLNNPRENVPTPMASFQPFNSTSELWTDYLARFRTFVTANSIPDNKQAQIFLTNQSNSVYKMLSNLAAQQQPVKSIHELTMNDIQTFMAEQFDPKRFVVRERFKFWSDMKRKPGETIPGEKRKPPASGVEILDILAKLVPTLKLFAASARKQVICNLYACLD